MNAIRVVVVLSALHSAGLASADVHVPAQYPSIQAAVAAAPPNGRIVVEAGLYEEQITVAFKDLTLVGRPGARIKAPLVMAQTLQPASDRRAIIGVLGATVEVRGFDIDGAQRGNTNPDFNGVVFAGAGGRVRNCRIHGVRNEPLSPGGFSAPLRAINYVAYQTPTVHLDVLNNVFEDNFDGILFTGDESVPLVLRVWANVQGNIVRGSGPTDAVGQRGIAFGAGADGRVAYNLVRDCVSTDPTVGPAVGILAGFNDVPGLEMPPIEYVGNVLLDNEVGIATIFSRRATILGNYVRGSPFAGIAVSGVENRVLFNVVEDSAIGIGMIGQELVTFGTAHDTLVLGNVLRSCGAPILEQTGVTGTVIAWNSIQP